MLVKASTQKSIVTLIRYLRIEVLFAILYSAAIYHLYEHHHLAFLAEFSFIPVGFFGAILSVFLAFRNNSAYDRWWEARKLWGEAVNASRQLGIQVMSLIEPTDPDYASEREEGRIHALKTEIINRHLACINLFRMQLRHDLRLEEVHQYLNEADQHRISQAINPGTQILLSQAECLKNAANEGYLTDYQLISMLNILERFYDIFGGCERIKNTPFPREYDAFIRCLIWILMAILPIYLLGIFSDDLSKTLIIPVTLILTLIIGFANKAGAVLEDPFENRMHDIPMTALCITIERDMRQFLRESKIPDAAHSTDHVIW